MNYYYIFGIVAGLCSVFAIIFYITSILKGETKPNRVSWFIWSITNMIILTSYFFVGARTTIFLPAVYLFNGLVVFILSLRYGVSSWSRVDYVSLLISGFSLLIWFLTKNSLYALLIVLLMDASAYLPTIKKIISDPSSESRIAWSLIFLGSFFNLLAINSFFFGIIIYPTIIFIMNGTVLVTIYRKKILFWYNQLYGRKYTQ